MTPDWQPVSRGLRLILTGAKVVGWSLLATVGSLLIGFCVLIRTDSGWPLLFVLIVTSLGVMVIGRLICTVGRFLCCRTPADAPAAGAAIRLAVIFETCGLLTWLSAFAILFTPVAAPELVLSGFGFASICNIAGRVFFFRYLHLIGQHVKSQSLTDEAKRFTRFSIVMCVSAVVGILLLMLGNSIRSDDESGRLAQSLSCVAGGLALCLPVALLLYLTLVYFILIAEAQRTVENYTPPPADDDPDREYHERYLAGDGKETDADT